MSPSGTVLVNRAPVLTLWATIVAQRLGHDRPAALTLGKAVAGLNAQSKGRRLGIFEAPKPQSKAKGSKAREPRAPATVPLLGRQVPVANTVDGVRAVVKGRREDPAAVQRYLEQKFGDDLARVTSAMNALAASVPPRRLAQEAFAMYEAFRPEIPEGTKGWGARGVLDLALLRRLAGG